MGLVFVAAVPTATRSATRRTHRSACPTCAAALEIVGELDGADVSRCTVCTLWWIDATDDDTRARRMLAGWRPYDEPAYDEPGPDEPAPDEPAPFDVPRDGEGDRDSRPRGGWYQMPLLGGGRVNGTATTRPGAIRRPR